MSVLLGPTTWVWLVFAGGWLIRLAAPETVPSQRAPAEARGWLLIIFIEPWAGVATYLLLGNRRLRRRLRLAELPSAFAAVRERPRGFPNIVHPELGPELAPAVRLAEDLGHLPILGGSAIEVLVDYGGVIDRTHGRDRCPRGGSESAGVGCVEGSLRPWICGEPVRRPVRPGGQISTSRGER